MPPRRHLATTGGVWGCRTGVSAGTSGWSWRPGRRSTPAVPRTPCHVAENEPAPVSARRGPVPQRKAELTAPAGGAFSDDTHVTDVETEAQRGEAHCVPLLLTPIPAVCPRWLPPCWVFRAQGSSSSLWARGKVGLRLWGVWAGPGCSGGHFLSTYCAPPAAVLGAKATVASQTEPNRAEQSKTEPEMDRAEPSQTEPGRTIQDWAEPDEPDREGQNRMEWLELDATKFWSELNETG